MDLPLGGISCNWNHVYVAFCNWLLVLSIVFLRFIQVVAWSHSFWLSNIHCMDIPHFVYPFHLVLDVRVASTFWLLQIVAMIFRERLVCRCVCVYSHKGMPSSANAGPWIDSTYFLRKCQSIFRRATVYSLLSLQIQVDLSGQ